MSFTIRKNDPDLWERHQCSKCKNYFETDEIALCPDCQNSGDKKKKTKSLKKPVDIALEKLHRYVSKK